MDEERKIEISVYYYIKSLLPSFVTVVDAFPMSSNTDNPQLSLPTVSVDSQDMRGMPFELGSIEKFERFWAIDIFAENKSQRDDYAYTLSRRLISDTIPVYDYDQGFPPNVNPSQIGYLQIESVDAKPIYVFRELVQVLYWRTRITFITKFTEV